MPEEGSARSASAWSMGAGWGRNRGDQSRTHGRAPLEFCRPRARIRAAAGAREPASGTGIEETVEASGRRGRWEVRPSAADGGAVHAVSAREPATLRVVPTSTALSTLLLAACAGGGHRTVADLGPEDRGLEPPLGRTLALTGDLRIAPGDYLRPTEGDDPVILLEGLSGVELDLEDVVLRGATADTAPDERTGVGIVVRDCDDLTLHGGELSGYRVGLLIEGSRDVTVEGLTVTDFFATELFGSPDSPHPADRLELDDSGTWLDDYGAAVAVRGSSRVTLRETRSRRGQNGMVLLESQGCEVSDSDHSYLSGWGVALADSVGCTIRNNRFDVCARGVSGDAPPDGLGAAGVLVAGGCERNAVLYNVARSCGDGLRIEGDGTGTGNLWFGNDLSGSLASAGAVHGAVDERLIGNRLSGGEWRGLHVEDSEGVVIYGNEFQGVLGTGLSVEDSRSCFLVGNQLLDCDLALLVRGHGASNDGDGESHWIIDNEVRGAIQDVVLERARGLVFEGNRFEGSNGRVHLDGLTVQDAEGEERELWALLQSSDSGLPSGRATDVVLAHPDGPRPTALEALGSFTPPAASDPLVEWRDTEAPTEPVIGRYTPWDPEGGASKPAERVHGGLLAGIGWTASWFHWDTTTDPRGDLELWRALRFTPAAQATVAGWNDPWGQTVRELVGDEQFGLHATGLLTIEEGGRFLLGARSDDGLRVTVDGEIVLESWTWKPASEELAEITLDRGTHTLVVEYFQIDGPAVLQLTLDPLRDGIEGAGTAPPTDD